MEKKVVVFNSTIRQTLSILFPAYYSMCLYFIFLPTFTLIRTQAHVSCKLITFCHTFCHKVATLCKLSSVKCNVMQPPSSLHHSQLSVGPSSENASHPIHPHLQSCSSPLSLHLHSIWASGHDSSWKK